MVVKQVCCAKKIVLFGFFCHPAFMRCSIEDWHSWFSAPDSTWSPSTFLLDSYRKRKGKHSPQAQCPLRAWLKRLNMCV